MLLFKRFALLEKTNPDKSKELPTNFLQDENSLLSSCEWKLSDSENNITIGEGEITLLKIMSAWNPERLKIKCKDLSTITFNGWSVCDLASKLWKQRTPDKTKLMKIWHGTCNDLCTGIAKSLLYMATSQIPNENEIEIVSLWLKVAIALVKRGYTPSFFDSLCFPHDQKYPAIPDIMFSVSLKSFRLFCHALGRGLYTPSLSNVLQYVCCFDQNDETWQLWKNAAIDQLNVIETTHPAHISTHSEVRPGLFSSEIDPSLSYPRYCDIVASKILACLCVSVFNGKSNQQNRRGPGIPLLLLQENGKCHLNTGPLKWISPPNLEVSIFIDAQRSSTDVTCYVYKLVDFNRCWLFETKMLKNSFLKIEDEVIPQRIDVFANPNQLALRKNNQGFAIKTTEQDKKWDLVSDFVVTDASKTLSYSFANFRDNEIRLMPLLPCLFPEAVNHNEQADVYANYIINPNHKFWQQITIIMTDEYEKDILKAREKEIILLKEENQKKDEQYKKVLYNAQKRESNYLSHEILEDKMELENEKKRKKNEQMLHEALQKVEALKKELQNIPKQQKDQISIQDNGESIKIQYYIPPEKLKTSNMALS